MKSVALKVTPVTKTDSDTEKHDFELEGITY